MQASLSSRLGEKFGRRRSGRASSVLTASRLPDARSTTRETTENAPRPITSQTSKRLSKSLGVPNASPTVLDSASNAAPRSPWSSAGGAAASRSQEPLATPRGRFCEWCDGIAASRVYWAFGGPARCLTGRRCDGVARSRRGRPRSVAAVQKAGERAVQALRPQFKSSGARAQPCAARASGASSCSPQKSFRPAGGLRDEGTSTATRTSPAREFLTLAFPVFRAHARAGEGSQGPSGPATRPREAWCSPAVERDSPNGPRASALGRGEGALNDSYNDPP